MKQGTITVEYIARKYAEYNALYFNGSLPRNMKFTLLRGYYTSPAGTYESVIDKKGHVTRQTIRLAEKVRWTADTFKGILLHEMVHASVTNKYRKNYGHGIRFLRECLRLEREYGVKVPYSAEGVDFINKPVIPAIEKPFIALRSAARKAYVKIVTTFL